MFNPKGTAGLWALLDPKRVVGPRNAALAARKAQTSALAWRQEMVIP